MIFPDGIMVSTRPSVTQVFRLGISDGPAKTMAGCKRNAMAKPANIKIKVLDVIRIFQIFNCLTFIFALLTRPGVISYPESYHYSFSAIAILQFQCLQKKRQHML